MRWSVWFDPVSAAYRLGKSVGRREILRASLDAMAKEREELLTEFHRATGGTIPGPLWPPIPELAERSELRSVESIRAEEVANAYR